MNHRYGGREHRGLGILFTSLFSLTLAAACDTEEGDDDGGGTAANDGHPPGYDSDTGDSGDHADSESDESGDNDGLEIAGVWIESYRGGMITHTIDATQWEQNDSEFGPFTYTVESYDNATGTVIGNDGMAFVKLQWTFTADDQLWYCTAAFGQATAADAEAAPDANADDPATGGCGEFAWSALSPG